jgi:hypothetical protein
VLEILCQEDRGHAPAPQFTLKRVLAREPALKLRLQVSHDGLGDRQKD